MLKWILKPIQIVLGSAPNLMSMIRQKKPSRTSLKAVLLEACGDLGLEQSESVSPVCIAYALLKMGAQADEVSRMLSWQEFEHLSAALLRVSGYTVKENVVLTKPRAQLDIVATDASMTLTLDCKHYRRGHSPSALSKFAADQLKRSSLLRKKSSDPRPIASVILSMSEPEGKFVDGVAVVPVRTLRSFLSSIDSYLELLEMN